MRSKIFKSTRLTAGLTALALLLAGEAAFAQQVVNLTAGSATATLPDGSAVPMWGYSCGTPDAASTLVSCASLNPAVAAGGWAPVIITLPAGQGLQINLTNSLPVVPTSIVIVGQLGGGLGNSSTATSSPDHTNAQSNVTWPIANIGGGSGTPPVQGTRVQSFSSEVLIGATGQICWGPSCPTPTPALKSGTYLIESGTHPSIQGPMGLYGMLVVTAAPAGTTAGTAYPATAFTGVAPTAAVTYNAEVPLLLSEIDPVQNAAVAKAVTLPGFSETTVWSGLPDGCGNPATANSGNCYPPAVNYTPLYYLFNGVAFDKSNAPASLFPVSTGTSTVTPTAGNVLVRFVNAGLRMHVPSIVRSSTGTPAVGGFSLIAEDGNPLPGITRVQNEVFMAAGKTYDVMINAPAAVGTALPVYDRQLSLSSNSTVRDAGMLAYIGINGALVPGAPTLAAAAANPDTYNSVISGQTLVVSDPAKGVIANDVNVSGVQVVAGSVTGGTLTLNTNGTFSFAATAGSGAFSYCGNGATSGAACTTVTLGAAPIEAGSGITLLNSAYTSTVSSVLSIKSPGILLGAKDAAGYPLTVDTTSVPTTLGGGTLSVDPSGAFNVTGVTAPGTYSFTFGAKNSQGTTSANTATVQVIFPAASGLAVTVVDGRDKTTVVPDYRWIIEEDRTFYVDPTKTTNTTPPCVPVAPATTCFSGTTEPTFGTNFHTSYMPVVAAGCVGPISCESGQTVLGVAAVCDGANGVCRTTGTQQTEVLPNAVALDPNKRYYISILPGDGAVPFETGNTSGGHGMGGAPIPFATCTPAPCTPTRGPITVLVQPTPFPTADLSVFVFQDDQPLNGENDAGGGALGGGDVGIAANEPGLGHFNIILFDDAGGTGDATGQMTYDMFNQPLSNSLDGTIDPVTHQNACPITQQGSTQPATGITGMIVTCPRYEADGVTFSALAGQARVANLMPGRYGVVATPGADLIAAGEEWLQTNTLDGEKAHDSFLRIGEPSYFQEFGPAGYHVSIGFANPKIINARLPLICGGDPSVGTTGVPCNNTVTGNVSTERMSRTPDERLYGSGSYDSFSFTQCYVSLGDPDGADFAFTKCDAGGNFTLAGIPDGTWRVTIFDQWNDMLVDGLSTPVALNAGGTAKTTSMGEIATNQWQANIYTSSFVDLNNDGVRQSNEPGLTLVPTNIRFRDGSYSNFNNTDLMGNAGFNEIFPLFSWYVIESDSTRFKNTGTHVVYDAGGPADGSPPCGTTGYPPCGSSTIAQNKANTAEQVPLPTPLHVPGAVYCDNADCTGFSIANGPGSSTTSGSSTGRIDPPWVLSEGWQGFSGQNSFLEFGKTPYIAGENGGVRGEVIYASTRPFDDPQLLLHTSWTPDVPGVTVNLYKEGTAPDGSQSLTLVDSTKTSSWDDWAQGFRPDGNPNMNCPGQSTADLFYFTLYNQPMYLDAYNNGGTPVHTIPDNSQYKCFDGMHNWNQLQPAPYDGMYNFPSVTARNPTTGLPTATNCTACISNPSGDGTQMLPSGKYVVEMVTPPGYELVKEEDKNILIGDNYIAPVTVQFPNLATAVYILPDQAEVSAAYNANNAQNSTVGFGRALSLSSHEGDTGSVETFWPCVGEQRVVPDYISLYPQSLEVAPFAGATRRLCDRKEVILDDQTSALAKFWIFTSAHVAAHFTGVITDDFTSEFDPFSPQFGEKFSPPNMPIAIKDWSGTEISRVYSDQWGTYNGLTYSTWEVNPPNPTGYAPTMMVTCMNDPGTGTTPDPLYNPQYSQFCYEIPFMPGQTQYMDTPVVPTSAFAGAGYNNPDCAYPDATPALSAVNGDGIGPWVSAAGSGHPITIHALGDQTVPNNAYAGPQAGTAPYNAKTVTRHYGFGTQGTGSSVIIGGVTATVVSWSDPTIVVSLPSTGPQVAACSVQQQTQYGGSNALCGELVVTASNGKQSIDAITVTIGGKAPTHVAATASIQSAIDAALPGDLIIVDPAVHQELLLMWKPVRLQGVGAASSVVNANTHPAGKLDPWRRQVNCLFGLSIDGTPIANHTGSNPYDPNNVYTCPASMKFQVDRLPLEATVGWDASLNGNLAEQLQEPTLMGAYEGAGITVLAKGVTFPTGTDPFGADTFPVGTTLLTGTTSTTNGCGPNTAAAHNPFPSNFQCNPSRIDGLTITDSSQGGGGIFVHGWAHNLEIANNRVNNNSGTLSGGISVGQGEFPGAYLRNPTTPNADPGSCMDSSAIGPTNTQEPYCFNLRVNVHHNAVTLNSSLGDELFSSTPSGAGGVAFCNGADYYQFNFNWVCGNLSTGDGGGIGHLGFIYNGDIEHNQILFNQSTNPTIPTNGGGLAVLGAPDTDPVCGNEAATPDADCAPGTSDGTGPNLVINANLFMGNSADSGSGGAIRLHGVNGTELTFFPTNMNRWNSVTVTNNIIANNVAGWDGAGVSLQDALIVNLINNTLMSNDTTASAGVLFNTLGAPLSSSPPPTTTTSTTTTSAPQPAGLVAIRHSPTLLATLAGLSPALSCPPRHPNCQLVSYPRLENNVFWENRSYYIGVGALDPAYQQNIVTLYNSFGSTPAPSQPQADATAPNANGGVHITGGTGACTAASYWDIGVRGDTGPANHGSGFSLSPTYSLMTSVAGYTGTSPNPHNAASDPSVISQYCNGSRTPPELKSAGWQVPPGIADATVPNPPFTLQAAATVDEGNNWVNMSWGPLAVTHPLTGAVLGNYGPAAASSPVVNYIPSTAGLNYSDAPPTDFYGNARKTNNAVDAGAVEFAGAVSIPTLTSIVPNTARRGTVVAVTLTGTNLSGGTVVVSGGGITVSAVSYSADGTTLNATFTISAAAARTARNVHVTTPGGTSNNVTFTVVLPTLASIAPTSGLRGTAVPVTLTGTFLTGGTVNVSGGGVTADPATVTADGTTLTTTLHITAGAGASTRNVTVATPNGGGTTNAVTFTVTRPTLTSVSPNTGARGTSVAVTLTGTSLAGATGVTVGGGPGVTVSNFVAVNDTTVTATFTVTSGAALAARNVAVTTASNGSTNNVTFTVVNPPAPTLTSISPNTGTHGTIVGVTLTGTNFTTNGTTVTVSGGGVTVSAVTVVNPSAITATFTITSGAALTARNVAVHTPGAQVSNNATFTVN